MKRAMNKNRPPHTQSDTRNNRRTNWPTVWRHLFTGIGAGVALILAACGSSPQSEASPAAESAPAIATPAIWALKDADTTIYLFGTVHLLKPDVVWLEGPIKSAFDQSDELIMEVIEPDPGTMSTLVTKLALNIEGPPLSSLLSAPEKERYLKVLNQYNLPVSSMDYLDPWMVAITLSVAPLQKLGFDQSIGVEKILEKTAREQGKKIDALETVEQQLGYFDSLPQKAQLAYLNVTVAEMDKVESEFTQLLDNWAAGRPDALAEQMNASMEATPELAQALLINRNARWTDWIVKRMEQPGTVFVAVGAGHLAGKDSVIDMLGKRDLVVRRLPNDGASDKKYSR